MVPPATHDEPEPDQTTSSGVSMKLDTMAHARPGQAIRQTVHGDLNVSLVGASSKFSKPESEDEMLTIPGGPRRASDIHHIPPGTVLDCKDSSFRNLHQDGHVLADYGNLDSKFEGKQLVAKDVNKLDQVKLAPAKDGTVKPITFGSAWITDCFWNNNTGNAITLFKTTWRVPPPPVSRTDASGTRQIIFLFNGIQSTFGIYQPVLCWGSNGGGSGEFWSIGSWYVGYPGNPGSFHSTFIPVASGQILTGVMAMTGQSGTNFNYNCYFEGYPQTALPITNAPQLTWCCQVLECYGITAATSYPPVYATAMRDIVLQTGGFNPAITWTVRNNSTECGQHSTVVSNSTTNGEVDLCYGTVSMPCTTVTSWGPGQLDVFGLGQDWGLYHKGYDGNNWVPSMTTYEALGGTWLYTPTPVSWGPGRIDVFGIGTDGHCYLKSWDGKWENWISLGGQFNSAVAAVSQAAGILDIFALGTDDTMYHAHFGNGAWGGWESLGGLFSSAATAVSWANGRLDIFALGTDSQCHHKWWDGANWGPSPTGWDLLGGVFSSPLTAVAWGPSRLDIFGLGQDTQLYHKWWDGSNWGPSVLGWEPLGGAWNCLPSINSWGQHRLDIFALDRGNVMYHKAWNGSAWSPAPGQNWDRLGGVFNGSPAAIPLRPQRLDIFGLGDNNALYHKAGGAGGFGVQDIWENLGGIFSAD